MNNIIKNIDSILGEKKLLPSEFGKYSKCYLNTTENIGSFLNQYYIENKNVLTVAGSGDQLLNAYLMGARNVDVFDINPLAYNQVCLKKAAVTSLTYQEYIDFFISDSNRLNKNLFNKIIPNLDNTTRDLFMYLYSNYDREKLINTIYYRFNPNLEKMQRMNNYLDIDNYNKLSSILRDKTINFINTSITELKNYSNNKYDMIMLSNISDTIQYIYPTDSLKEFKRLIHSLSKNLLLPDGIIQVGYIYDYYINRQENLFNQKEKRLKVFTPDEFITSLVESYSSYGGSDGIVVYYKKRTSN